MRRNFMQYSILKAFLISIMPEYGHIGVACCISIKEPGIPISMWNEIMNTSCFISTISDEWSYPHDDLFFFVVGAVRSSSTLSYPHL